MSRTDDAGAKQEYAAFREEMIDLLKILRECTAYGYAKMRFRKTVFFMIHFKGIFARIWLFYPQGQAKRLYRRRTSRPADPLRVKISASVPIPQRMSYDPAVRRPMACLIPWNRSAAWREYR